MNKDVWSFSTFIMFGLFFLPKVIFAAPETLTHAYPVHDNMGFVGTPNLSATYYYKSITVPYSRGKVFLSSTPDGAGPITFSHNIEITGTYPTGGSFRYSTGCGINTVAPLEITQFISQADWVDEINIRVAYKHDLCSTTVKVDSVRIMTAEIGQLYLVHVEPGDEIVSGFLQLPWEYTNYGLDFHEAALRIENDDYSITNTYDWSAWAGAKSNSLVLAAGDGSARLLTNCGMCGKAVAIDHGNGYQTRYYYLKETQITVDPIMIMKGDPIGALGMSGASDYPHIHFFVIQDIDEDGDFEDDLIDGIIDPFNRSELGNYLWDEPLNKIRTTLTTNGGQFYLHRHKLVFPKNFSSRDMVVQSDILPAKNDLSGRSIENILDVSIHDGFGNKITTFSKPWQLTMDFSQINTSRYVADSLSIYSRSNSNDQWVKEETLINPDLKTATISINHLSQFTLLGELLDSVSPITTAALSGSLHTNNIYTSAVELILTALDEQVSSLGVANTYYKINSGDWTDYIGSVLFSTEGSYIIEYFSIDGDDNVENVSTLSFLIDFTPLTPAVTPTIGATSTPTPIPTHFATSRSASTFWEPQPTLADSAQQNLIQSDSFILPTIVQSKNIQPGVLGESDQRIISTTEPNKESSKTNIWKTIFQIWTLLAVLISGYLLVFYWRKGTLPFEI